MADPVPFYGRDGLNVQTYDARTPLDVARTSVEGDVAWYVRKAAVWGGPVLDVASGTGRVSWPLADSGVEVVGLELSPWMLAAAEAKRASMPEATRKRATFVRGDMTAFDLARKFRAVFVPFRSFQCLLQPEAQRAALERFRAHLAPGGRLVLNLFDPRYEFLTPRLPPTLAERDNFRHPLRRTSVTVEIERLEFDAMRQFFRDVWIFRELDASGSVLLEEREVLSMRWTFRWEMRHLLTACGFKVEAEYSDFLDSPPEYGREQVWVARVD
jgi:SAM-dependent methyltransferase